MENNNRSLNTKDEKQVQEKINDVIKSLDLPNSFEFGLLVKKISEKINQEIEFFPCIMTENVTGIVVSGEKIHIFFEAQVSPIHQIQIKLHELGHTILGHIIDNPNNEYAAILKTFFTSVNNYKDSQPITMARRDYDAKSEQEAELFATELISRIRLDTYASDDPIFSVCIK